MSIGRKPNPVILYSVMYACCAAFIAATFLILGKALIWNPDGYNQHYMTFCYIRQSAEALFRGEPLRLFDFRLGPGLDVLTTLCYCGLTDPLSYIACLFSVPQMEYGYALIAFLHQYLTGICLIVYLRTAGIKDRHASAWSAMIYACCGFAILNIGRHPYFMNGMIYLPLILAGVEKLLSEGKWKLYVLSAAMCVIANFYFAYMNTVIAILYIIVRLAFRFRERRLKGTARDGFALLGGYLLGMALSAFVMLPVVLVYMKNSRLNEVAGYQGNMLHFRLSYYLKLMAYAFTGTCDMSYWTCLHFIPLVLCALTGALFVKGRRTVQVMLALVICALMCAIPYVGRVMNGFGYVSNRWCYAIAFFAALGCAIGLEKRNHSIRKMPLRLTLILSLLYSAFICAAAIADGKYRILLYSVPVIIIQAVVYCFVQNKKLFRKATSVCVIFSVIAFFSMQYMPFMNGYISEMRDRNTYSDLLCETAGDEFTGEEPFRSEQYLHAGNEAFIKDFMSNTFFWSLIDSGISEYYKKLYLPTQQFPYLYHGLGGSTPLNAVASVKYHATSDEIDCVVPDGFHPADPIIKPDGTEFRIFENDAPLPFGYTYSATLSEDAYAAMPIEQRYQALTAYAICDEVLEGSIAPTDRSITVPFEMEQTDDYTLRFGFDAPAGYEWYLVLERPRVTENFICYVTSDYGVAGYHDTPISNNFGFQKYGVAICLGGGELPLTSCTMACTVRADTLSVDSIRIVGLPLDVMREDLDALRAEPLTDIALSPNRLTGNITVEGERILQISVPYSNGWHATVDGQPAKLFSCGDMYTGIRLSAGEHSIQLDYFTPGLKIGLLISGGALIVFIAFALATGRRRHA